MFDQFRAMQYVEYNNARSHFIANPQLLIELEQYITDMLEDVVRQNLAEIVAEYNEASYLYPFWQNYPPEERGRMPKGDQYPWIEVGEHAVGAKLARLLDPHFTVSDFGLPTGADQRLVLKNQKIKRLLNLPTSAAWLFADIKSVGPRDDFNHAVMSHNQISADGVWDNEKNGVKNKILKAVGKRKSHDFHASLPPLFILSNGTIAPMVNVVVKPVYNMLSLVGRERGQPLKKITLATIPNGILLTINPNYRKISFFTFPWERR